MTHAKVRSVANLRSCGLIKGLFFDLLFLRPLLGYLIHTQTVLSGVVLTGLPRAAGFLPQSKDTQRFMGDSELCLCDSTSVFICTISGQPGDLCNL